MDLRYTLCHAHIKDAARPTSESKSFGSYVKQQVRNDGKRRKHQEMIPVYTTSWRSIEYKLYRY